MLKNLSLLGAVVALSLGVCAAVQAADDGFASTPPMTESEAQAAIEATMAYWTPERMASAIPMPMPARAVDIFDPALTEAPEMPGPPGYSLGWMPGDGPQPDPTVGYSLTPEEAAAMFTPGPQHGTMPTNPLSGPYGPFQRWTWFGAYLKRPLSAVGKLFFTIGSSNYVCSATTIGRRTIATAAHCMHDGAGNFYDNWMYCPSYNAGGVNPKTGCWSWSWGRISSAWAGGGDPDFDYGCLVTAPTGTIKNDNVGNVTGWLGRAWNWGYAQPEMVFGYPSAPPFPGYHIIVTAAAEWYTFHFTSGDQISKFTGNDMTPGSSGGGWILGLGHRSAEWPDTDNSNATDPAPMGVGYINGVNSHKRCRTHCGSPPTATAGVFWQEMSSPPFLRSTGNTDESEDVFVDCLNQE